jgi:ribosomal protein L29
MKTNDLKILKMKKPLELEKTLVIKRSELLKLVLKKVAGGEKNLKKPKNLRKEIAQVLTIIKEKEIFQK